ncbi:MAG: hypothetical protein E7409_05880 [Ruminococcaceae bacterium]|nr:hypothetical protein [Oscillospiraceae bacterium]
MQGKFHDQLTERLMRAICSLQTPEECSSFLEDLCTIAEIKAMAQRLEVARMLEKHMVYSDIVAATGASTATISRVNRALNYGADGYKLVLDRVDGEER